MKQDPCARFAAEAAAILHARAPSPRGAPRPQRAPPPSGAERRAAWAAKEGRPRPSPVSKRCGGPCKLSKPATSANFYRSREAKDGLQSWCKACQKARDTSRAAVERATLAVLRHGPSAAGRIAKAPTVRELVWAETAPAAARTVKVDVFGEGLTGDGPPDPGRLADVCARSYRAYEREERERRAFDAQGARIAEVPNRLPKENPYEVWSVADQAEVDRWADDVIAYWRSVVAERKRLRALGWNGKAGIPDGVEEE